MAKRKEIKFRRTGRVWEGRQGGVIFRIYEDRDKVKTCANAYSVTAQDTKDKDRGISTAGHRYFHLDAAKEFCQQIAAGELDLAAMRMEFEAENMARERAAIREAAADARKFHARLETAGLKYTDLLELEVLRHNLGDMGHNILLGYERGEGWPECCG